MASLLSLGLSIPALADSTGASAASVTEVNRRLEAGSLVVGLIVENHSAADANLSIACAAQQDGRILEGGDFVIRAIGPGKKGYDEVTFDQIHRIGVDVSCWVDDLSTAE